MKTNRIMKFVFPVLVFVLTSAYFSCDNPTGPIEDTPGRRDYTWTVDTLNIEYPAYKIWGSSPSDVWSINTSPDLSHSFWLYDGNKWSTDGVFRLISPHALFGFARNNVFAGGDTDGRIWHFDGNSWEQIAVLTKPGTRFVGLENIWGESANDFYAVGAGPDDKDYANFSVIAHFTNNEWDMLNTDSLIGNVVHLYKNKPDNKIYLRLTKIGGTEFIDSTIVYEYNQGKYTELYGNIESIGLQCDISLINGEVYFILGNRIAKRVNDQFQTVLQVNNPKFYQRIWGRNSNDIFLLMTDGLAHYNGSDVEYLFHFTYPDDKPSTQIFGAAIFEKEAFFTVYEPPTHLKLIYHGKLKN